MSDYFIIVNAEEDIEEVNEFKKLIHSFSPSMEILILHPLIEDLTAKIDKIMEKPGFIFFFITQNFCKSEFCKFVKDMMICNYLKKKIFKFAPVLTQSPREMMDPAKSYNIPFLLQSITPFRLYCLTKGENISNVGREQLKTNDEREYACISNFFAKFK